MLTRAAPRTVIGFGAFRALYLQARTDTTGDLWWIRVVSNFLLDLQPKKDFRKSRFELLRRHLDLLRGADAARRRGSERF